MDSIRTIGSYLGQENKIYTHMKSAEWKKKKPRIHMHDTFICFMSNEVKNVDKVARPIVLVWYTPKLGDLKNVRCEIHYFPPEYNFSFTFKILPKRRSPPPQINVILFCFLTAQIRPVVWFSGELGEIYSKSKWYNIMYLLDIHTYFRCNRRCLSLFLSFVFFLYFFVWL